MRCSDLTLASPAENLACDEALLDLCEAGGSEELLRFWEPAQYFVVVGYANKAGTEANLAFCRANSIPVLRRCSGGGTVLQGPGCLNYSLILRIGKSSPLEGISATNEFILQRNRAALSELLGKPVELRGHTDLAVRGLKFSGNAQRRHRNFLLFHGSFLLQMDISLIEKALPMPSQQPGYRAHRGHTGFLLNLEMPAPALKAALRAAWNATEPQAQFPFPAITALARDKYLNDDWNLKF